VVREIVGEKRALATWFSLQQGMIGAQYWARLVAPPGFYRVQDRRLRKDGWNGLILRCKVALQNRFKVRRTP